MPIKNSIKEKPSKILKYIPERNKIGAILRTTDNLNRFPIVEKAINALLAISKISLIHIMIYQPMEEGGIRSKLAEFFGKEKKRIQFENYNSGNFYSDLLNYAVNEQSRRGIDYSLIMSAEAYAYASENNLEKMLTVAKEGAYAIGLNIAEYSELIEQGYISNAFCLYRNTVTNFVDVWGLNSLFLDKEIGDKHFGSEELSVVKNFIENYGYESLAIVNPEEGKLAEPVDEESKIWRQEVLETKKERFYIMCKLLKIDAEKLKDNLKIIN